MTTYTWTDNTMRSGSTCNVDEVADNLMHLKYDNASGILNVSALGSTSSSFTATINTVTTADFTGTPTVTLPSVPDSTKEAKVILDFSTAGASYPAISTTGTLKWSDKNRGLAPSAFSTLSGVRNILVFVTRNGGTTWEAEYSSYGSVETTFSRPNLALNGTLGGSTFAVSSYNYQSLYCAYLGFDGNPSTFYTSTDGTCGYVIFYNPTPLKVTLLTIMNHSAGTNVITAGSVYGSNDNSSWTYITPFTNSNTAGGSSWNISLSSNTSYYNYYKLVPTSYNAYGAGFAEMGITATYIST